MKAILNARTTLSLTKTDRHIRNLGSVLIECEDSKNKPVGLLFEAIDAENARKRREEVLITVTKNKKKIQLTLTDLLELVD